jgi:tetratricopeptide (TPR) repeat protein
MTLKSRISLLLFVFAALLLASPYTLSSQAADALSPEIRRLQTKWEAIKFGVPEGDDQTRQMNALGEDADAVAAHFPAMPEALIWDGIITSERASMASTFYALGFAKRARDILEQAYNLDPAKLDAGATTSLGVLYYRVPGFPIGFGDKAKARQLLEQAVKLAPNGLDAWYFYGDFLYTQNELPKAVEVFQHALKIPQHPDRPLWDKNRRLVIEELLAKIESKR